MFLDHASQTLDIATIGTTIVKWGVKKYVDYSMLIFNKILKELAEI